ncbi:MAG TPA: hypothetical protein VEQ42_07465, partial [Pyrinomonadaceae bacterium]|nr:hypothetical protein [Pyrinomonadaceae bacterium]
MNLPTRRLRSCLLALLVASLNLSSLARAQTQTPPAQTPAAAPNATQLAKPQAVAFVGVNVVPMDRERVVTDQTVVVRDGRIAEVGPASKIKVPDGALRIDGRGKYLMPGLAEMHGHLPHPNMPAAVADSVLFLFVANGVTTVRGMFGFPNHVTLRERAARNEILSPTLYVAGPALSGQSVQSAGVADVLVREHKKAGYDLLKVHEGLSREAYDRIVTTANELRIPFGGHVADNVGLLHAIKSKQSSVEHMDGYLEALEADDSPVRNADPQTRAQKLRQHLDERNLPARAAA